MPGIYDDVGFDAYGAGREARNQLNNVQAFGRGVKQVASGVAEMPGKTWDGMNAAAAPMLDRQFDAMAVQGNAIRGAGANFVRGFNGPADAPYAEDAPRIAPPRAALPAPADTQRPDGIPGSAARIQAANPRGVQAVPQMARNLVQESQQRFAPQQGVEGSIGVDGYMRQIQNIRALNQMDTPAGPGILGGDGPTWQERQNAEMTRRGQREDIVRAAQNNPTRANTALARQQLASMDHDYGTDSGERVAGNRDNTQLTAEGMRNQTQFGVEGMRNQAQFGIEGLRGRNQLAAEGMRGRNQLDITLLGEELRGRNLQDMEGLRFNRESGLLDRRLAAEAPYRDAQAGLFTAQAGRLNDEVAHGKTELGMYEKLYGTISKTEPDPQIAHDKTLKAMAAATKAARLKTEGKAADGAVGYAEGGGVGNAKQPGETDQAYLARISKQGQDYTAGFGKPGAGLPSGVPGMVSYELGGVQRRSVDGIDHITDPNAPGGANYQPANPSGLAASGGYGTYSGSGQARGVTPWDQTAGGRAPQPSLGETPLMGSSAYNRPTGLAFGGAVPPQDIPGGRAVAQAVAGRQVFGQSDGSGRDDALPAVIDGERPAALTSGEFVWPVNAVKFYGMDKLNKMLAAAEKGMASQGDTA